MTEREICGVLCLDKPSGVSSHDMVYKVRKLYGTKKVGHTGTLDPMASGVLVMLIGRAAKLSEFLLSSKKRYIAELTLGIKTDTQDSTGEIISKSEHIPTPQEVRRVCETFIGQQMQTPPMFSAKKVGGQKLYDLARDGIEVERKATEINVYSIKVDDIDPAHGVYSLDIQCSKGTYIRTLCNDIGERLGCFGVMSGLRRVENGVFSIEDSYTPQVLEDMQQAERDKCLASIEDVLREYPKVVLPKFFANLASHGCEIYQKKIGTQYPEGALVRMYDGEHLFALGQVFIFDDGSAIKPVRQF